MLKYRYLFIIIIFSYKLFSIEISSDKFYLKKKNVAISYFSNMELGKEDNTIERLVISIHSLSYSAKNYLQYVLEAGKLKQDELDKTIIVAPHFLKKNKIPKNLENDILFWDVFPFWGSSKARVKRENKRVRVSAYQVIDEIMLYFVKSGLYPNLEKVVLLGHSAGGQFVNRYSACNIISNELKNSYDIEVKYLVMAPSSYVYMDSRRIVENTRNKFDIPRFDKRKEAPKYNNYGYGLDKLYKYLKKIGKYSIINQFKNRKILYLIGSKDNADNHKYLAKSPGAMMQGKNRLERAINYFNYLKFFYGKEIMKNQNLKIIKNIKHSGRKLIKSKEGREFIFE